MHRLDYRLKLLKKPLKELYRTNFPDVLNPLEQARSALEEVKLQLNSDSTNDSLILLEQQQAQ